MSNDTQLSQFSNFVDALEEVANASTFLVDPESQALTASSRFVDWLAPMATPTTWNAWVEMLEPQEQPGVRSAFEMHVRDGIPFDCRTKVLIEGVERIIDLRLSTIRNAEGQPVVLLGALSSPEKQSGGAVSGTVSELLQEHQSMLMQSARLSSLGILAGGIAHEINNPLAIIIGKVELIRERLASGKLDPVKGDEILLSLLNTCGRITKIIKGLRVLSRDGSQDPIVKMSVTELVDESLQFCSERLKSRGITLTVGEIPPDLQILGRTVQLGQVFVNLLNNASDAVEKYPEPWIRLEVESSSETVDLRIVDCGPGIPKEIRDKLMLPFFTTKEVGKGTGLGLSISRSILEQLNGALIIDEKCPNTCFIARLPRTQ
jgi:C4-dicarboxylate-specific signal transduction histidine kinase